MTCWSFFSFSKLQIRLYTTILISFSKTIFLSRNNLHKLEFTVFFVHNFSRSDKCIGL